MRRLCFFDFGQVATAKALSQLAREGVTPARIRRSLEELGAWLPDARRALVQLEALEKGGPLFVRTADGRLAETSGQLRLEFEAEPADGAPALAGAPASPAPAPRIDRTREEWFERGVAAEEDGRYDEAVEAYETTLSLGRTAEALFNLGNVLYAQGRKAEAAKRFLQATEIERDYVEAWNNLGNVLIEIELPSEAVQAYRRALAIEPDYADAHFNLAELLASRGELSEARRHWEAYLRQDPHSPWAREVRERLRRISDSVPRI